MKTNCLVVVLAFLILVPSGCSKNDPVALKGEKVNSEIKDIKTLGPAGKAVKLFFKNWEFKQYEKMCSQTVHSRDEEIFVQRMRETPIEWRNLVILSEEASGDDWEVSLSLEVTDVASAFAACVINLLYTSDKDSKKSAFRLTPSFLAIQRFMPINQTWRVINLDGKYFIDLCVVGSKGKRHENVMNYVLDAGILNDFPAISAVPSKSDGMAISASAWLAMACINMNIPAEDAESIMKEAVPLVDTAKVNLKQLITKFRPTSDKKEK